MATPTIPNGEEYFFPVIYSGNGQGQRVGKFVPFTDSGTIANSVMFNDADDAYLARTFSTPTNNKKWTYSVWFKRCTLGTNQALMSADYDGATYWDMRFNTSDQIYIQNRIGSSNILSVNTTRTFKDTSKWYHLLFVYDSDNSTSTSRAILYIDGDVQTLSGYPSSGDASAYNVNSEPHHIGVSRTADASGAIWSEFDGYFAEANFVDGQALLPASFGETDTSTGRWIPSTVKPYPTTTTTYTVTVVGGNPANHPYHNVGSTNKYGIDGSTATADVTLTLIEGATYKFDQSDSSNSGHPLRFSTTANGTHGGGSEYTTGVTTVGTPGSSGAYTEITVATGAPTLYYYCTNHSAMGWTANTQSQYGTNGFRLKFQDSSAFGDDTSGNGNDFTSSSLTASDQRTDSPTNNIAVLRNYDTSIPQTITEGGLRTVVTGSNTGYPIVSTLRPKGSGKFYCEVSPIATPGGYTLAMGVYYQEDLADASGGSNWYPGGSSAPGVGLWIASNYDIYTDGTQQFSESASSFAANDVIGMAADLDNGTLTFYNDDGNVIGGPIGLKNKSICFTAMSNRTGKAYNWNFGDNPTFNGTVTAGGNTDENGEGNFYHTVPTGFKMLKQDNMATTARGVSGLVWTKNRESTDNQIWMDSSRGAGQRLESAETGAQVLVNNSLNKFLAGGQQIGSYADMNRSRNSFVSWNWVANSGTTSSNTDGNVTCNLQVNNTAKFSIQTWTNTGAGTKTIGHGLGVKPGFIIQKRTDSTSNWFTYHHSLTGNGSYLHLNNYDATQTGSDFANTEPTSSVFSSNASGSSSATFVSYCWAEVEGFSKFGKYVGNGVVDGPFVYTGFKVRWLLHKANNGAGWYLYDTTREPNNPLLFPLFPNTTAAESSNVYGIDLLSNGFKLRQATGYGANYSGVDTYYWAFAEHPFVGDGTSPTTAR